MSEIKNLSKLLKIYYQKKDSPFIANWIITSQCNCKCSFCELGIENKYNPAEEVTTERAFEIVHELKEIGVKYVTFSGGEVFLRKDIWDIIKELKTNGFKVGIVSNGLLLNSLSKEKIEFMNQYLDTLVISIDSSIPSEHNMFRNTPQLFELIMKGIIKLQLQGFKNITFESIIMSQNYKRIPELIQLTKDIGIRKIMFRPINIISNFPQLSKVSNKNEFADYDVEEIIKYIDLGIEKAKKLKVDTDLMFNRKWITEYFKNLKVKDGFFHDKVMKNYFCFIPFAYVIINYNGGLLPCLLLNEKGNIREGCLKEERKKADGIREQLGRREFFDICNCCFDQANNNVRFSTMCSPVLNVKSLKLLFNDVMSVKRRFEK
jgi:MoaA/NifB/PqqE/SkfB family radical SAM enzyme